ncbi:MAG: hypothetical protein NZ529_09270 [Cytophagaceae bacterium]|nr:hypothetical protein [Cytophagaceae bacterium]MDW8456974.1 hypothetical protein [Cytophagaceae bacterium]
MTFYTVEMLLSWLVRNISKAYEWKIQLITDLSLSFLSLGEFEFFLLYEIA